MRTILRLLLLCLPLTVVAAAEPVSLKIDQTRALMPDITAYLYIYDADGAAVSVVQPNQLEARVGSHPASVRSVTPFKAAGEGVAYIFLVDISRSLNAERFIQLKTSLDAWVDALGDKDRAALLTVGNETKIAVDFTADKAALKAKIGTLRLTDNTTRLHDALMQALDMGRRTDHDLPGRRAIVMLSDGLDDVAGGATREEVLTRIKEDRIPIYAIGYSHLPMTPKKDEGLKNLGIFARTSGGEYIPAGGNAFSESYAGLRARIQDVLVAKIDCPKCEGDGREYPLHLELIIGTQRLPADQDMRLLAGAGATPAPAVRPQVESPEPGIHWGVYAVGAVMALLLSTLVFRKSRDKTRPSQPEVEKQTDVPAAPQPPDPVTSMALQNEPDPPPSFPTSRCRILLTAVSAAQRGQEWRVEIGEETLMGRSTHCGVTIDNDEEVSSRHCVLSCEHGTVFVQDRGSTNGTFVNGVPIVARHALVNGDLILLGRTEMRITLEGEIR